MTLAERYLTGAGPVDADPVGVALSGGGVRAACLGLGTLQVLEERRVLERARHVAAVSGGSYIATAFLVSRRQEVDTAGPDGDVATRPWARGSAEELHLRQNLHYLADGLNDLLLGTAVYLAGMILNLVPLAAALAASGLALGAAYGELGFLEQTAEGVRSGYGVLRAGAVAVAFGVGAGYEYLRARWPALDVFARSAYVVVAVLFLAAVPDLVVQAVAERGSTVDWRRGLVDWAVLALAVPVLTRLMLATQWSAAVRRLDRLALTAARTLLGVMVIAALSFPFLYLCAAGVSLPLASVALAVVGASAVLVLAGLFVHANNTSLHHLYASRLDRAYVVRAGAGPSATDVRLSGFNLTDLAPAVGVPELVVCSAVNLRASESALGESCGPFVFSYRRVGSPLLAEGTHPGYVPAAALSSASSNRAIGSLVSLIAASGGAVAPNMGRYSTLGTRLVMALLNVRLGCWIPNPVQGDGSAAQGVMTRGWYEPGPLGALREAIGNLSIRHRHLFVSDGGHWDNSGVVELLRRRCSTIFCCDAASDLGRLGNLMRLISLARSELGVELATDERLLGDVTPVTLLRFRYPEDAPGSYPRRIVLMRAIVSSDMPADLVARSRTSSRFPRHSSLNQFLSSSDVDAYVALGRWLASEAVRQADLPARQPEGQAVPVSTLNSGDSENSTATEARLVPLARTPIQ